MYEFIDRLFNFASPRIRDFQGFKPDSFDGPGRLHPGAAGADDIPGAGSLESEEDIWYEHYFPYIRQARRRGAGPACRAGAAVRQGQ